MGEVRYGQGRCRPHGIGHNSRGSVAIARVRHAAYQLRRVATPTCIHTRLCFVTASACLLSANGWHPQGIQKRKRSRMEFDDTTQVCGGARARAPGVVAVGGRLCSRSFSGRLTATCFDGAARQEYKPRYGYGSVANQGEEVPWIVLRDQDGNV